jgi:hypothetical protein
MFFSGEEVKGFESAFRGVMLKHHYAILWHKEAYLSFGLLLLLY